MQHEAAVHAEVERHLQRLDGGVAAVGVAREVGLAHPAHQVADVAPPGNRRGEGEEQEVAARHEAVGQAVLLHREGDLAGERGVADLAEHAHVDEMVLAQPICPLRQAAPDLVQHHKSLIQLDPMPLTVVEGDRLDMRESL